MRALLIILLLIGVRALGQEFSLSTELAKQLKYYPEIAPYVVDTSGVVGYYDVEYAEGLTMDIFAKPMSDGAPAIIMIHGGGWASGSKEMDHPIACELARRGMVAACVDYRKSGEAKYPAAVEDVESAILWFKENAVRFGADSSDVTLYGTSAGGQLAALIGAKNEVDIERVIDVDGVLAFLHPDSGEGRDKPNKPSAATRWFGVHYSEDSTLWVDASPLTHVGPRSADFFFINSGKKRFSAGQKEMIEALEKNGKTTREERFENTPHTFWLFLPWAPKVVELIAPR